MGGTLAARQHALDLVAAPGLGGGPVSAASDRVVGRGVDQVLPVAAELRAVLPWAGLRRGATVSVAVATGSTSLLFALLAAASRAGAWCAAVGFPALGVLAAAEVGVVTDRLVLVPRPGPEWATTAAALLDGLDVVLVRSPGRVAPAQGRRLAARARTRGAVLLVHGEWPGADVALRPEAAPWRGLGHGRGRLRERRVTVRAHGRGTAARHTETDVWLPTPTGTLAAAAPERTTLIPAPGPAAVRKVLTPAGGGGLPGGAGRRKRLIPAGDGRRKTLVPVSSQATLPDQAAVSDRVALPDQATLPDEATVSDRVALSGEVIVSDQSEVGVSGGAALRRVGVAEAVG